MSVFGDGIDWGHEARRAAQEDPPGAAPGEMLLRLREALATVERPRIVDAGCNIGRFCAQFSAAGFEYVGIDQSEQALAIARERMPGVRFEQSFLWDDWPARIGPCDAALCNAVLQHNTHAEKRRILPRIAEVLRPGGFFAMQESTVERATATQLQHAQWVDLVESFGLELVSTWHLNPQGLPDAYLYRRL
jgi:SAM-dependent methyltransferase